MTRWFRWYEGTTEDGKFRVVARNADVTVATVMGVWAVLLEDASHPDHRGIAARGEPFYCAILDLEEPLLINILSAMESVDLISVGHGDITITKWKERQFETDATDPTNADRQRRYRARRAETAIDTPRNASKTPAKRPDTDTDTDTDKKFSNENSAQAREFDETFWPRYPHKVGKPAALKSFCSARKRTALETIVAGLERYIASKPSDRKWLNPTTFLNQERWADEPAATVERSNGHASPSRRSTADIAREFSEYASQRGDDPVPPAGLLPGGRH